MPPMRRAAVRITRSMQPRRTAGRPMQSVQQKSSRDVTKAWTRVAVAVEVREREMTQYVRPARKVTVTDTSHDVFSSLEVFNQLNTLGNTSSGPDEVPAWFLRLASPFIAKLVAYLFNQSLFHSVVPHQWKRSVITPVAKVALPSEGGDS